MTCDENPADPHPLRQPRAHQRTPKVLGWLQSCSRLVYSLRLVAMFIFIVASTPVFVVVAFILFLTAAVFVVARAIGWAVEGKTDKLNHTYNDGSPRRVYESQATLNR